MNTKLPTCRPLKVGIKYKNVRISFWYSPQPPTSSIISSYFILWRFLIVACSGYLFSLVMTMVVIFSNKLMNLFFRNNVLWQIDRYYFKQILLLNTGFINVECQRKILVTWTSQCHWRSMKGRNDITFISTEKRNGYVNSSNSYWDSVCYLCNILWN